MAIPHTFPEQTKTLGPPPGWDDLEKGACLPLPVWCDGGQCVSLWRLSWRERVSALIFGKIWVGVVHGNTQPPIWLGVSRQIFSTAVQGQRSWIARSLQSIKSLGR